MKRLGSLTFCAAVFVAGCGSGDALERQKTHRHELEIENRSPYPLTAKVKAYYSGYCKDGADKAVVPPKSGKTLSFEFKGCTNGGGESIDSITIRNGRDLKYNQSYPKSRIICDDKKCVEDDD